MHIAVEAVGNKHSGGAEVLRGVVSRLCNSPRITKVTVYCSPRAGRSFDFGCHDALTEVPRPREERSYFRRMWWYLRGLSARCEQDRVDLVLCINGMGLIRGKVAAVAMIQQSLPFSREAIRTLRPSKRSQLRIIKFMMAASCRTARKVFVQSTTMRGWVHSSIGTRDANIEVYPPETRPILVGESPRVKALMGAFPRGNRILYIGSDSPYKNLHRVAAALHSVRRCVGAATLFATIPDDHPLCVDDGVIGLDYLSSEELGLAYKEADVVVQPSLVESGPLVPGEAMQMGRPLLAADRPWAREFCKDAALYFDPLDEDDIAEKTIQLLSSMHIRLQLVDNARRLLASNSRKRTYTDLVESIANIAADVVGIG